MLIRNKDLVPEKKKKTSIKKILAGVILGFALGQGSVFLFHRIWIFPFKIKTSYMEPYLSPGTTVYINQLFSVEDLQRGDLVLLTHPDSGLYMIRRVIALPGDTLEIRNRIVFLNGQKFGHSSESKIQNLWNLNSPVHYTNFSDNDNVKSVTVKENQLFVLADNRRIALDSRHFGPLSYDFFKGKLSDP